MTIAERRRMRRYLDLNGRPAPGLDEAASVGMQADIMRLRRRRQHPLWHLVAALLVIF